MIDFNKDLCRYYGTKNLVIIDPPYLINNHNKHINQNYQNI